KSGKMMFPIVGIEIFFAKILIFVGFGFKFQIYKSKLYFIFAHNSLRSRVCVRDGSGILL
ncbi:MAG: hypothetical protein KDC62_11645, partial [Aequorivita sp.]|nr:hypothetical protein [Aequorivita sp.]